MTTSSKRWASTAAIWLLGAVASANAAILSLSPSGSGAVVVSNVLTQGVALTASATCCGSNVGTLAAAPALDRVYFISGGSSGQSLHALPYSGPDPATSLPLPLSHRVTHAIYDVANARILSVALDTSGIVMSINAISPATAQTTPLNTLTLGATTLRSGIIAKSRVGNSVFLVGRSSGGIDDRLLRFDVDASGAPLAPAAFDVPGETLLGLAVHPSTGVLYGLSRDASSGNTRLLRFDFAPSFSVVSLGVGITDCCAAMAGSVAIDSVGNALYASTRSSNGADISRLRRFDLTSGTVTSLAPLTSAGLFEDLSAPLFDRIFANGFD